MVWKMLKISSFVLLVTVILILSATGLIQAQDGPDTSCDIASLIAHQQEHAENLASFADAAEDDLESALKSLYVAGVTFQALAVECGISLPIQAQAQAVHDMEHKLEDNHDSIVFEVATSIGDPVNGASLFYTFESEVSFACATCHYSDSTDRLVGPGLLGIGNPEHSHDDHGAETGDDHNESMDTHEEDTDDHADATYDHQDDMIELDADALLARAEYLRISIIDPSAFIVPDYPDLAMPQKYAEVLSEQDINDLIAYLLTSQ